MDKKVGSEYSRKGTVGNKVYVYIARSRNNEEDKACSGPRIGTYSRLLFQTCHGMGMHKWDNPTGPKNTFARTHFGTLSSLVLEILPRFAFEEPSPISHAEKLLSNGIGCSAPASKPTNKAFILPILAIRRNPPLPSAIPVSSVNKALDPPFPASCHSEILSSLTY